MLDHWKATGSPPTLDDVKKKGHSIAELINMARGISAQRKCALEEGEDPLDSLVQQMTALLDEFAKGSRYFNLDRLAGKRSKDSEEPLVNGIAVSMVRFFVDTIESRAQTSRKFVSLPSGVIAGGLSWAIVATTATASTTWCRWR